jgi:TRAP-type mannitol/chloroaromatic compound transport system substrate-binding protein
LLKPAESMRMAHRSMLIPRWPGIGRLSTIHPTNNEREDIMKRRDFIKLTAGLATTAATSASLSMASAQSKATFKAADVQPPDYPTVVATETLGSKLQAATNGRLSVQVFPSAQLGAEKETI